MKKAKPAKKQTPLMGQYLGVKAKYPDAILLFRVGDFYETFGSDAVKVSKILGIVLTSRNNGGSDIELAGFPYHSLDTYLPRLVKAGYRVAICEQLEKPSKEKKIVKRGVTDIVTPGVTIDDGILDHKSNNFLASIQYTKRGIHGISFLDISTGEFIVSQGNIAHINALVQSLEPKEILYSKGFRSYHEEHFGKGYYTFPLDEWVYTEDFGVEQLTEKFQVKSLKGFGIEQMIEAQVAAGASLYYLGTTENRKLDHISKISRIQHDDYVWLDQFTIRNLELLNPTNNTGKALIDVLDNTSSPMGARMLKKWIILPLKSPVAIQSRLERVSYFLENEDIRETLCSNLKKISDLERLVSKLSMSRIHPREINQIKVSLECVAKLKEIFSTSDNESIKNSADRLQLCETIKEKIATTIVADPPTLLAKGGAIADGNDDELDELRGIVNNSKDILLQIQKTEAEKTGITSLKIGFNNVFGYYLEVTNKYKNQGLIPDNWIRKQTLTGSERYITEELKKLETKILTAEDRIQIIEEKIFYQLVDALKEHIYSLQNNAQVIAELDCVQSFAQVALKQQYVRPVVNDLLVIDIKNGRHPVIEQQIELGESYVPNDTYLDNDSTQVMMITGPNMSGKSAVLRQTALICLMAQMGSYVPADSATLGYIDKLFVRVGASDNISSGESTFMVEMHETAGIMNNISNRSLILLDEIGRGTSTYDGISIAWSLAEFLHNNEAARPKTLFATHYHELNELAKTFDRIKNFNVSTKEVGNKVIFLRKLVEGGSHHSFGIHVAKMAGMPISIVKRAAQILHQLEQKAITQKDGEASISDKLQAMPDTQAMQLSIFETSDPKIGLLKKEISSIELNSMTPIDCMLKLKELIDLLESD